MELVPTPDKIPLLIHYFLKMAVLIRKKPCNLAGVYQHGKTGVSPARLPDYPVSGSEYGPKKMG
jgi:hypothetical protein